MQDKALSKPPQTYDIEGGYVFNGFTEVSAKLGLRQRRIRLKAIGEVFTLAPAFVLPYMRGKTETLDTVVFLMRFHVPYWALAYVFGRTEMYWYRLQCSLGRLSVVGTTVMQPESLPRDLVADEKHTRRCGQKAYVAMTAGADCLGASVATEATKEALAVAYGVFAEEAKALDADYAPETVDTDGWKATQNAWKSLFPAGVLVRLWGAKVMMGRTWATLAIVPAGRLFLRWGRL